jgi:hypothetical protein
MSGTTDVTKGQIKEAAGTLTNEDKRDLILCEEVPMKPKTKPGPSLSPDAEQASLTADWNEREHTSEPSQVAAQNLVDVVGSPALAKHAIDVVEQSQSDSSGDRDTPTSPTTVKQNASFVKALEDFETSLESAPLTLPSTEASMPRRKKQKADSCTTWATASGTFHSFERCSAKS